jgi:hypothetical protein
MVAATMAEGVVAKPTVNGPHGTAEGGLATSQPDALMPEFRLPITSTTQRIPSVYEAFHPANLVRWSSIAYDFLIAHASSL